MPKNPVPAKTSSPEAMDGACNADGHSHRGTPFMGRAAPRETASAVVVVKLEGYNRIKAGLFLFIHRHDKPTPRTIN